jgi:hypothetical protein
VFFSISIKTSCDPLLVGMITATLKLDMTT